METDGLRTVGENRLGREGETLSGSNAAATHMFGLEQPESYGHGGGITSRRRRSCGRAGRRGVAGARWPARHPAAAGPSVRHRALWTQDTQSQGTGHFALLFRNSQIESYSGRPCSACRRCRRRWSRRSSSSSSCPPAPTPRAAASVAWCVTEIGGSGGIASFLAIPS